MPFSACLRWSWGSIWLAAAEEVFLSLKVPVIASINQQ
jgi:hypothetical protein